jgi:ribokinase
MHPSAHILIGTGGIGTGRFFAVDGNTTLGREESRGGHFLDRTDFCKLHIIAHYVRVLMPDRFATLPIGMVGDDIEGRRLINDMAEHGIDTRFIRKTTEAITTQSFCIVYPDGSGGNLTTTDSASGKVNPDLIRSAESMFAAHRDAGIALAAPEVPLPARKALLELGSEYGFLRAASFTAEEMISAVNEGMFELIDVLSINRHEAEAMIPGAGYETPVETLIDSLLRVNGDLCIAITDGGSGVSVWDGVTLHTISALRVKAVATSGAGDAFFAGFLCGLGSGMQTLSAAIMGNLVAGFSVTGRDTIHRGLHRETFEAYVSEHNLEFPSEVLSFLSV